MLRQLSVRDVVLIDRLELELDNGLCVLTGETGAGKSILLDSLGLALGVRADSGLVRPGADQAVVSAIFDVAPDHAVCTLLREQGFDDAEDGEGLLLRRIVSADGRSRAFVNDQPASVGLLRQIGDMLVEIQGQFDRFALATSSVQRDALDAFGGLHQDAAAAAQSFAAWRAARETLQTAEAELAEAREIEARLREDVAELDTLAPQAGEEAALAEERQFLQNAERLIGAFSEALTDLSGDSGADSALQRAARILERAGRDAGGRLDPVVAAIDRSVAELADATQELQSLAHSVDTDSDRLSTLEDRLFALHDAARKHRASVDELPALHSELAQRLAAIDGDSSRLADLAKEADSARRAYMTAAEKLSKARHKAAGELAATVMAELAPLKLDKASFTVRVDPLDEADWSASGVDNVYFLVATNPGSAPGPLGRIASGGELSRFLLALKVALSEAEDVATLIFDEVDAGVGGATAAAVGERLARLAAVAGRQILVVTHSPQVAAVGRHHWRVAKLSDTSGSDAVLTRITRLAEDERREEIARMLAGSAVTDEARAAAERLLSEAAAAASGRDAA